MHHQVDPVHGAHQAVLIPHVANKVADAIVVEPGHAHFVLLQFIAAENDDLLRLIVIQ